MNKPSIIVCLLASLLLSISAFGKGHEITLKIEGIQDEWILAAHHYGDKQMISDTLFRDKKDEYVLSGKETLPGGIYIAVIPSLDNRYFEFIVSEQEFELRTKAPDFVGNMDAVDSKENKVFYDDLQHLTKKQQESERLKQQKKALDKDTQKDEIKELNKKIDQIQKDIHEYRNNIIVNHSETFYANLLKAMKDIKIPDPPADLDSTGRQLFKYQYYKDNYWSNFDFTDDRLARTPVYHNKLRDFFNEALPDIPDTVWHYSDVVLKQIPKDSELMKYGLVWMLNRSARSKIMCMDLVYVNLVDNYYSQGYAFWIEDTVELYRFKKRASALRKIMCGKAAPNIVLKDTQLKTRELYKVESKYTLVYFWDPDCGHCKKETPKIKEIHDDYQDVMKVYSVASTDEYDKWTKFIEDKSLQKWIHVTLYSEKDYIYKTNYDIQNTPVAFLLDDEKKIIAKRLGAKQLREVMEKLEKKEATP